MSRDDEIRARFADEPTQAIADTLGVSYNTVVSRAKRMGLVKSAQFLQRYRFTAASGARTRFQPGHAAHVGGASHPRQSWFRTCNTPKNTGHVGATRRVGGYLQIKVDMTGDRRRDWKSYHQHVWELEHGPIRPDQVVVFVDGAARCIAAEITVDRLECITRAEQLKRVDYRNQPQDVVQLHQLRALLSRAINRRTKEST